MVMEILHIVFCSVVGEVQVVGLCGEFACKSVDLFYYRSDTFAETVFAHRKIGLIGMCR